ncbi:hypothetical protein N7499_000756 [Penicillium canescens]|uniref:Uncharacterized protein n=1 Tax=Penicillium canescens TaxID=5083 RepID=A0AAD6IIM0_PENCN|nr:uncharacterized protein N7446_011038 [Penicillium canescens]KAJ6007092.1 hypothetical protein N7522_005443 [Penicillium canescens]KAJ6029609.1 hypothetical protein N7444_012596 [Penicillium canescens]KAJ6048041.1 hypothetical protein N7460_004188 [Penicillium canescens]KAJ6048355.1 hypothetical protein N7446_011038 [Penicillium canescens]KAJ6101126.1 hypothetical protein N7499_000756 [Penicillium canescens]
MADNQHQPDPFAEGLWVLDDTGKNLGFMREEELDRNFTELADNTLVEETSPEAITKYLCTLTATQTKIHDDLRDLGWNYAAIHNFLTILENAQLYNCAMLRKKGYTESEIDRLDALGNQNLMDFSHLKRGLASLADEKYQMQLYLLEEVKRRRLIMLGEK